MTIRDYAQEMGAARFVKEVALEAHIAHVRAVTAKPVVSVGRFTSPEHVPAIAGRVAPVLIVGAGPAGLEAALTLGRRGVPVILAEAGEPGGRVTRETRLPGLSEWAWGRDWRLRQISKLPRVEVFAGSTMTPADVISTGAPHVLIATGSLWRRDRRGRIGDARAPGLIAHAVHDGYAAARSHLAPPEMLIARRERVVLAQ